MPAAVASSTSSPTTSNLAARIRTLIAEELPNLIAIRHDLHAHPELGYEEHRTSKVIQRELAAAGIPFKGDLAGGTGVMAHLPAGSAAGNGHDGATKPPIGLRADIDALPIEEKTGLPYASTIPGKMHACGHDGHTTMLIGAAKVLNRLAKEFPGGGGLPRPVSFLFQPAEEGGAGAKKMIDDGCLAGKVIGPPIAEMFGLHGWPRLPLGIVGTRKGPLLAASDRFDIRVKGVGSHAAWPHVSRDPIVAAAAIVTAVQTIASRNVGPLDAVVVSLTMIHAGAAFNVIPDSATISGTVRTLKPEILELARRRLGEIASGVAQAHGCTAELDYRLGYPVTLNHDSAVDTFNHVARASLGQQHVVDIPEPVMGGEDFSFYSQVIPSCFFVLGLIPQGQSSMPDLHQPDFNFNDEAMATGIEMFCQLALRE